MFLSCFEFVPSFVSRFERAEFLEDSSPSPLSTEKSQNQDWRLRSRYPLEFFVMHVDKLLRFYHPIII